MNRSIFLFAGEGSGDLLGGELIQSLHANGAHHLYGVGGPKMRKAGFDCLFPMEQFQLMGLKDILLGLPRLFGQFQDVKAAIVEKNPDAVVLIDYPGFNLRLAKSLRKAGYKGKIIHYVSPTVWVWGKKRIDILAKYNDLLLTLFPFEPPLYAHTSLPTTYVGHPAVDAIRRYRAAPTPLQLPCHKKILALFPGSRLREIQMNLDLQLQAAKTFIEANPDYQVVISCAQKEYHLLIEEILGEIGVAATIVCETYPLMQECDLAIAKSGTCNLELALFGKPTAVVYQIDWFNKFACRYLFRLKLAHASIVNILAGRRVMPEFVIEPFTIEELTAAVASLSSGEKREACIAGCQEVSGILGCKPASDTAAIAILQTLP